MSDSDSEIIIKPERDLASSSKSRNNNYNNASSSNSKPKLNNSRNNNDEEDEDDEEESDEEEVSPKGRKRIRKAGDILDDGEEQPAINGKTILRDKDRFCVGSIVRIHCVNFLTYDNVTCYPGPDLNMIIGPNGTGKSSLASAIVLGLGASPKILGKDHISVFVKTGESTGSIEIELKGQIGKKNVIIKRELNSTDDTTKFKLNGSQSTAREVTATMAELSIQLNNLCTFLPQDRVNSFSHMNSAELLVETQRAAGDPRLSGWHKILIEARNMQKTRQTEIEKATQAIASREDKQRESEATIKQFETRRLIEAEIAVLSLLVPCAKYNVARETWVAARNEKNERETEMKELEAANKPFKDSEDALDGITEEYKKVKKLNEEAVHKIDKDIRQKGEIKDTADDSEKLDGLKSDFKHRAKIIKDLGHRISVNEQNLHNKPATPDLTENRRLAKENQAEQSSIRQQLESFQDSLAEVRQEAKSVQNDITGAGKRLKSFSDVQENRERGTAQFERDTWYAIKWMRENRDKLAGKYFEPARLTVSAREKKFAQLAEGPISIANFRTFVFEKQQDYDYLMTNLADKDINIDGKTTRLRISSWQYSQGATMADFPNKFSDEQLHQWGFDCHAIDLVEGPPEVLLYLCFVSKLHEIPVCTRQDVRIDMAAIERSRQVKKYYDLSGSHGIKFSRYGNKESQVEQRDLPTCKVFGDSVDTKRVEELQQQIREWEVVKAELIVKVEKFKQRDKDLHDRFERLVDEKADLEKQRSALNAPLSKWSDLSVKNDALKGTLKRELAKPSTDKAIANLRKGMTARVEKRIQLTLEQSKLYLKKVKLYLYGNQISLQLLQAETDLRAMESSASEKDQELKDARAAFQAAKTKTAELHSNTKALLEEMNTIFSAAEDTDAAAEAQRRRTEQGDPEVETIEAELMTQQAALDNTAAISPSVLEGYEKRKREIAEWKTRLAETTEALEEASDKIAEAKALWLPKVNEMAQAINEKFSAAFDTMGTLGEVGIAQDEDYAKWGMEIKVSFRDGENVQLLTGQRQSGGERALTTVMYLMALAEICKSPFALVDEINQGMDQRVERFVHNALVKVTCKDEVGQYFLLTPKLLPNLDYHERMKVLCVHNGTWLPDTAVSVTSLVKNKIKKNKQMMRA